jgi:hypothetical protein
LERAFKPNEMVQNEDFEKEINRTLEEPPQIIEPIKFFAHKEIQRSRKAPGYDLTTRGILK